MNELFVNIKVDREERPDLDAIYQHALALLGEQGGWPLTMFLTPDGEPFWGGTYFPPEPRWGRPGFPAGAAGDRADAYRSDRGQGRRRTSSRCARRCSGSAGRKRGERHRPGAASTASPSGCCARSIRSTAASAPRPNSRNAASSSCCGAAGSAPGKRPYPRRGAAHPDDDLPGRHLRPSRRRLRPLFDRCALAGAAFREDALRQCRAGRPADPGLAGDARPALSRSGSPRRSAGSSARC